MLDLESSDSVDASPAEPKLGPSRSAPLRRFRPALFTCFVLAVLWAILFNELRIDWSANAQYGYGWAVPLLAFALLWRRWNSRPPPVSPTRSGGGSTLPIATVATLPLLLLGIRLVEMANPEWRLILWLHASLLVAVSLVFFQTLGGYTWTRHFFFPICFVLVAVPWPSAVEQFLVQKLMAFVAAVATEVVNFSGVPAIRHGNVIEISNGMVGIDEACSGVRSFQSSLMMALFLGELYRFNPPRRLWLLFGGIGIALLANLGRSIALVLTASNGGLDLMHRWHDRIGLAVLLTAFGGVLLLASLLRSRHSPPPPTLSPNPDPTPTPTPTPPALSRRSAAEADSSRPSPTTADLSRRSSAEADLSRRSPAKADLSRRSPAKADRPVISPSLLIGAAVWIVLIELGTETWYRMHETNSAQTIRWSLNWPTERPGFHDVEIADTARALLRCDLGRGAAWRDQNAIQWMLYFLRWEPGRSSAQLAKGHAPEICLQVTGKKLVADLGIQSIPVAGLELPFHQYVFDANGQKLHVFYCLWEDHTEDEAARMNEDWSRSSRLQAVALGKRNRGQQVLELAFFSPMSPEHALTLVTDQCRHLVRAGESSQN